MALVACNECGKEISDKAPMCPHCGSPSTGQSSSAQRTSSRRKISPGAWLALAAIIGGIVWYSQSQSFREQSLPPIPVSVEYREAILGPGMVLRLTNTSDAPLVALVELENPTTKELKSFRVDLTANGTSEIGHSEGWVLAMGDNVEVSNNDYRTWTGSIR